MKLGVSSERSLVVMYLYAHNNCHDITSYHPFVWLTGTAGHYFINDSMQSESRTVIKLLVHLNNILNVHFVQNENIHIRVERLG